MLVPRLVRLALARRSHTCDPTHPYKIVAVYGAAHREVCAARDLEAAHMAVGKLFSRESHDHAFIVDVRPGGKTLKVKP